MGKPKKNDHWRHLDRMLAFIKLRTWPSYVAHTMPSVREIALRYRMRQQDVVEMLECNDSVRMNVGFRAARGVHEHESIGDYRFEWMGEV